MISALSCRGQITQAVTCTLIQWMQDLVDSSGQQKDVVFEFAMRCCITLFAEQAGLLPDRVFTTALKERWICYPEAFKPELDCLWQRMLLFRYRFFAGTTALELTSVQLQLLLQLAEQDWCQVEPAVFGTVLEWVLEPQERHRLGMHYTPRTYVERLVQPVAIEPLRSRWQEIDPNDPAAIVAFLQALRQITILDPACGSGNFLYVTLDLLRELELEVLAQLQRATGMGERELPQVSPAQMYGIELEPRTAAIASLTLWIANQQWYKCHFGATMPLLSSLNQQPTIACRDALLTADGQPAPWPAADYIITNPPFLGKSRRRTALGDRYLETLFRAYPTMPPGADYMMWWWFRAFEALRQGRTQRFGLIATNSITQPLNRRVITTTLQQNPEYEILWAIPDHPWKSSNTGAAVRIAAIVVGRRGQQQPILNHAIEIESDCTGEICIHLAAQPVNLIHPDLRSGIDLLSVKPLNANRGICSVGLVLFGQGFLVDNAQRHQLEPEVCHPLLAGRTLLKGAKPTWVIDLYPLNAAEAQVRAPRAFQYLRDRVKPQRQRSRDPSSRKNWWRFGRDKPELRAALSRLCRYIVTLEVSKHRTFFFLPSTILPDHRLVVIALEDAFFLGVLSSRIHTIWALAMGSRLEDRPCYTKTRCFDPFPFPHVNPRQYQTIRYWSERLDVHRKQVQTQNPDITITELYNCLEKIRSQKTLTAKEGNHPLKMATLRLQHIHNRIDAAVLSAYGWPPNLNDEEILDRLVRLNAERFQEESSGKTHWLRYGNLVRSD